MTRDRENKGRERCIWYSLSTLVVLIWMMGRCNIYKGAREILTCAETRFRFKRDTKNLTCGQNNWRAGGLKLPRDV